MQEMTLREASLADLDAIALMLTESADDKDPLGPYRYPGRRTYPDDYYQATRQRYGKILKDGQQGRFKVVLIELPANEEDTPGKVVSLALWALYGVTEIVGSTGTEIDSVEVKLKKRHVNPARDAAMTQQLGHGREIWFNQVYGDKQIFLRLLETHPGYRQRGAASMLLNWGQEKAAREGLALGLYASPMGLPFYTKRGFKEIGNIRVQVDGEDEYIDRPALVWLPPRQNQNSEADK